MSAVKDSYTLELLDKILAPLKRIEAQAERVGGVMERLEKMCSSGLGMAKLAGVIGGAVVGLGLLGTAVSGVVGLMEKAAHGAWEFGRGIVEAARFASASKLSLDVFLGKGQGEGVFNRTLGFGNVLPMDERDVVKNMQALAGSGYTGQRLDMANAALADIESLRGKFYSQNLLLHLQRLQNEARPQARDVNMAAIDAGTGLGGIYKQLYKQQGMAMPVNADSEEGLHAMTKQYEHWVKAGKIGGRSVADAIMAAVEERFDEGNGLGFAAKKLGLGTLGGLLSNLEAAPQRFLMQIGVEKMEGIKALMTFLQRVLEYFNLATPQGRALGAAVEKLVNSLLGGLKNIKEDDLERFFKAGLKVAEKLVEVVQSAWDILDKMMHDDFSGLVKAVGSGFTAVGKLIGAGIIESLKALIPSLPWPKGTVLAETASKVADKVVAGGKMVGGVLGAAVSGGAGTAARSGYLSVVDDKQAVPPPAHERDALDNPVDRWLEGKGSDKGLGGNKDGGGEDPRELLRRIARDSNQRQGDSSDAAGVDLADAILAGLRRRAQELRDGGGDDSFLDELLAALRGSAARLGAPVS